MAIKKLSDIESIEALVYDRVFMDEMKIKQRFIDDNNQDPLYDVSVTYRMYAVGSDDKLYYKNKTNTMIIEDFYGRALQLLNEQGDAAFLQAMGTIQGVVAYMIALERGIQTEVV